MDETHLRQILEIRDLESAYEQCLHEIEANHHKETMRTLRVQLLLHDNENSNLYDQLAVGNDRINKMVNDMEALGRKLEDAEGKLKAGREELRIKAREIETLKAEVQSLHNVTMDSTKLLTEKLTLSRELSLLKPEIDYLRSQASSNQSLLAEKLSQEAQIGTLQTELDKERRCRQQISIGEGKAHSENINFEAQIQAIQSEARKERKERQKAEREVNKISHEWEIQRISLESRLDAFRNKLKATKEHLKDTREELQHLRSLERTAANEFDTRKANSNPAPNLRKRNARQMTPESMIGISGIELDNKIMKRTSALPGDKSMFSITPYLNRTISVASESLPRQPDRANMAGPDSAFAPGLVKDSDISTDKPITSNTFDAIQAISGTLNNQAGRGHALELVNVDKSHSEVAAVPKRPQPGRPLEKVVEEDAYEAKSIAVSAPDIKKVEASSEDTVSGAGTKKRKRKLLGSGLVRTHFDNHDGEIPEVEMELSNVTNAAPLSRVLSTNLKGRPTLAAGLRASTFGTFSPLKRNRQTSSARA